MMLKDLIVNKWRESSYKYKSAQDAPGTFQPGRQCRWMLATRLLPNKPAAPNLIYYLLQSTHRPTPHCAEWTTFGSLHSAHDTVLYSKERCVGTWHQFCMSPDSVATRKAAGMYVPKQQPSRTSICRTTSLHMKPPLTTLIPRYTHTYIK